MPRRIEIEITSVSGDTATWRAAGAKLPKGSLASSLIAGGPVVGQVYRAEVDQFMEGVEILAVSPAKESSPLDPKNERLKLLDVSPKGPDVQVSYASKGKGRPRRDGDGDRPRTGARGPRERSSRPRADAGSRGPREAAARNSDSRTGTSRPDRSRARGPVEPPVSTIHRNALLATLSPEQLPVAEQLLRGGMPAVRAAVAEQNKTAEQQGRTTVNAEAIDRIAEDLLKKTNLALWKDRATGAIAAGKELRLRDLRAIVTSAKTVTLDEDARLQLKELQVSLTTRVDALRTEWTAKLDAAIASSNVTEALRLAARPPEHTTRVSAETATKIATLASEALRADVAAGQWNEIVTLAVDVPMRRLIKPTGIPADESSQALARKNAGSIPELAKLLGMKVPPPPPPVRSTRRVSSTRRPS